MEIQKTMLASEVYKSLTDILSRYNTSNIPTNIIGVQEVNSDSSPYIYFKTK